MAAIVEWYEHAIDCVQVDLDGGGAATLATLIPPATARASTFAYDADADVLYLLTSNGWEPVGGSGAIAPVVQQIVGAGAQSVNADTDVVTVDPAGGATILTIPTLASRRRGRRLQIIQVGPGTVAIVGADPIFAGTSAYVMAGEDDAVALSPQTGGWRLVAQIGAPNTFEVWVSSTGSDSAVGTLADPLATLKEAIRRASVVRWYTTAKIHGLGAVLTLPAISVPGGIGSASDLLEILGDVVVVATGTITSFTAQSPRSPLFVTDSGAAWTPGAFRGGVLRFLSGALTGVETGVFENTLGTLETFRFDPPLPQPALPLPAPGDTFEIVQNVTTLAASAVAPFFSNINPGNGFRLKFNKVNLSGFIIAQELFIEFARVRYDTSGAFLEQNCDVFAGVNPFGLYLNAASPVAVNVGSMKVFGLGMRNIALQVFKDNATVVAGLVAGTSRFNVMATADLSRIYCDGALLAGGTSLVGASGAYISLTNATINNVVGGAAVGADNGRITMSGVQGTGNASPCVRAESGSSIKVTDPNAVGGTTITAGGADVKVGANAPVNWASIATGFAVSTTDIANASSQMCRVGA